MSLFLLHSKLFFFSYTFFIAIKINTQKKKKNTCIKKENTNFVFDCCHISYIVALSFLLTLLNVLKIVFPVLLQHRITISFFQFYRYYRYSPLDFTIRCVTCCDRPLKSWIIQLSLVPIAAPLQNTRGGGGGENKSINKTKTLSPVIAHSACVRRD